jgi:hypothetical protein
MAEAEQGAPAPDNQRAQHRHLTKRRKRLFVQIFEDVKAHNFPRHDVGAEQCWQAVGARRYTRMEPDSPVLALSMRQAISDYMAHRAWEGPPGGVPAIPIAAMARQLPPSFYDAMLDPEKIEAMFKTRGLGESGSMCPICLEPKKRHVAFSRECGHGCCLECCDQWIRHNSLASGGACPGCLKDAGKRTLVDPALLYGRQLGESRDRVVFASFQIPLLQRELDEAHADKDGAAVAKCPACMSISSGRSVLRRCGNPRCAIEFCAQCDSAVDGSAALRAKHLTRECSRISAESSAIASATGFVRCRQCGTSLWHARGHGCHHVKCPECSCEQCHSCGRAHRDPECRCPIYCNPNFKCRCADACPECAAGSRPCQHCLGGCESCLKRRCGNN